MSKSVEVLLWTLLRLMSRTAIDGEPWILLIFSSDEGERTRTTALNLVRGNSGPDEFVQSVRIYCKWVSPIDPRKNWRWMAPHVPALHYILSFLHCSLGLRVGTRHWYKSPKSYVMAPDRQEHTREEAKADILLWAFICEHPFAQWPLAPGLQDCTREADLGWPGLCIIVYTVLSPEEYIEACTAALVLIFMRSVLFRGFRTSMLSLCHEPQVIGNLWHMV